MSKLNRVILKLLPVVIVLLVLAWFISSLTDQAVPIQRATYHNITKININYPYSSVSTVYTIKHHPKTVTAIVSDINSQSYGKWRENIGGKESSNTVSINLYSHPETLVASFSLYSNAILERARNYRQLNAQGFHRQINIKQLPALREVWCDRKNIDDYDFSQRSQHCLDQ